MKNSIILMLLGAGCLDSKEDSGAPVEPGDPPAAADDTAGPADPIDADGDGYGAEDGDCDDADPAVYPEAEDAWYDGVDSDCAGNDDFDADRDGYAAESGGGPDCDDADALVSPAATDACGDALDEDCDGTPAACAPGVHPLSGADARIHGATFTFGLGCSLAAPGDLDGDGDGDLLVGAAGYLEQRGAVYAISAPLSGEIASYDARAEVSSGDEELNIYDCPALAGAGDVDGDGYADVLIGDSLAGQASGETRGAVYLVYGPFVGEVDLAEADATFWGEQAWSYAGKSISFAGDLDGDGAQDLLVGAPYEDELEASNAEGAAYLLSGAAMADPLGEQSLAAASAKVVGGVVNQTLGDVAGVGDVDGDGMDDAVISGGTNGDVWGIGLFYGPLTSGGIADADSQMTGNWAPASQVPAAAGDLDGDGRADLLFGMSSYSEYDESDGTGPRTGIGRVYVVRGAPSGDVYLNDDASATIEGMEEHDNLGSALSGAGDLDRSGQAEILIAAPGAGEVYLFPGDLSGFHTRDDARRTFVGSGYDELRAAINAGDLDGDGLDDLAVGGALFNEGASPTGAAWVVSGVQF